MKRRTTLKGLTIGVTLALATPSLLRTIDYFSDCVLPRIDSQQELERVVEEEKRKLGLDVNIIPQLRKVDNAAVVRGNFGNLYLLVSGRAANRKSIKHELREYELKSEGKNTLNDERAILYSFFGYKI